MKTRDRANTGQYRSPFAAVDALVEIRVWRLTM